MRLALAPTLLVLTGSLAALPGCAELDEPADGRDDAFLGDGKADAFGVVEGSPEACAVLRLVNEASFDELRTITNPASVHIDNYRNNQTDEPEDDQTIDSLAELDAIPFVGPVAFARLLPYALAHYPCGDAPAPSDDPEACAILRAANESSVDQLDLDAGLDRRAALAIVDAQPIATLEALDAVPYVGDAAVARLAAYAASAGLTCEAACAGTGGTFDGVAFTAAEECRAVEFMNRARLSQMAGLGATLRHWIYDCAPIPGKLDCTQGRGRRWTRLAELDPNVGGTSMAQLRSAAAAWVDDGAPSDTIAATWAGRDELLDKPVGFDSVFVVRRTNPGATSRFCYELRDAPGAANFLTACVWLVNADSTPACADPGCLDPWIGRSAALRGTLKAESFPGGVGITLAPSVRPLPPR